MYTPCLFIEACRMLYVNPAKLGKPSTPTAAVIAVPTGPNDIDPSPTKAA